MKRLKKAVSLVLTLAILLSCMPLAMAEENQSTPQNPTEIGADTVWSYLDDGSDPAGDSSAANYSRTSWTLGGYDVSGWKTASGSFGAKNGAIDDLGSGYVPGVLLSQYKDGGSADKEAFFFRTMVYVEDASAVKQITGSVIYDDAATVYINGNCIAGFDDSGITAATPAAATRMQTSSCVWVPWTVRSLQRSARPTPVETGILMEKSAFRWMKPHRRR